MRPYGFMPCGRFLLSAAESALLPIPAFLHSIYRNQPKNRMEEK